MKRIAVPFLFILIASISFAQQPIKDDQAKDEIKDRLPLSKGKMLKSAGTVSNQESYDVNYYSIDVTPDPVTKTIDGMVQVVATVVGTSLNSIQFDFSGDFIVSSVLLLGNPGHHLSYSYHDPLLTIVLDSTFIEGNTIGLEIAYQGVQNEWPFFQEIESIPAISLYWGMYWFPCKYWDFSDRADSVDIIVTVPNDLTAVASGSLEEVINKGDTSEYHWHVGYPSLADGLGVEIYAFEEHYDEYVYNDDTDTMKIYFYTYPGNYEKYRSLCDSIKVILTYFSSMFGEYPYVKDNFAYVDVPPNMGWTAYACYSMICMAGRRDLDVAAHEISHQWWGGIINMHHIWLSEGFASYSQALWYEYENIDDPSENASTYARNNFFYTGPGTVYAEDPDDLNNGLIYGKAAYVLHMLRHLVGDSVFFEILKTYGSPENYGYKSSSTEDFQRICEQVSGMDLEHFFHQWIYEELFPWYRYKWGYSEIDDGYLIKLDIEQVQQIIDETAPIFNMPIDIEISTDSYDTTFVAWDSLKMQSFEFEVQEEPTDLILDPDDWILKRTRDITGIKTFDVTTELISLECYPNPFRSSTTIQYQLPREVEIEVAVYDIMGRKLTTIVNEKRQPGIYEILWNADELSKGTYYCILKYGQSSICQKMLILE